MTRDKNNNTLLCKDEDLNAGELGGCPNPVFQRLVARQLGNLCCFSSSVMAGEKLQLFSSPDSITYRVSSSSGGSRCITVVAVCVCVSVSARERVCGCVCMRARARVRVGARASLL